MNWVSENRHWLLFAGVVLSTLGAVGVAVVGLVATLSTLVTGGPILGIVAAWILGTLVLAGLDVVCLAALLSELASRASMPKSQRAADFFHRVESALPPLAALGLGDRFEPSVEARRAELTERYVDGDLSEAELEAELQTLLDEDGRAGSGPVETTRESAVDAAKQRDLADDREVETET
ncbi:MULTISPECIES: hypothetical protein [Haloarcula]|uniref:SHOCT domain-containing protein n=1 Tax=Haloarcula pellucida TaxID=1427151 RepID=A0A830GGU0_9EURY|nr:MULTISPECIES: hypothetical protein [Halomicroarcula]MBX0346822.1 hypothetical protein [Halomicroarcula pellucida]MDS0277304.1 hypothetical protein [Halomicroarcula sp. S1AR25-4]GGN85652.1 hypothetical protein GCM10009030_02420 [Halomicroarcula pellucida]